MEIDTLIELYDERPLENVLGVEMFRPRRVVYICPQDIAADLQVQKKLRSYFSWRSQKVELIFHKADIFNVHSVLDLLRLITERYSDCAIDITGGTDAVLFAVGMLCAEAEYPVFTYSRKKNRFYNIKNAPFADGLPCTIRYNVEDFFRMAGGSIRQGRVDNSILSGYLDDFEPFFRVFMDNRREWDRIITYIQRLSPTGQDGTYSLTARGPYTVKGQRASRIDAPEAALRSLQQIDLIRDLTIGEEEVSFRFRDGQIRVWLRDVGSVLELYVYKVCLDTGLFEDVRSSVIVDWEGEKSENSVSNELDVMCASGVVPLFISCKTCDAKTEALNELAILRDRFGGNIARAAIVTAERGNNPLRKRAAELGIRVIDLYDLQNARVAKRLRALMR